MIFVRPDPLERGFGFFCMVMRRYIPIICVLAMMFVGRVSSQTIAQYAGEFLSIGAGARSLAMGGAYTALAADASGGYWNPAALGLLDEADIMLMHEERFAGLLNYDLGAAASPYSHEMSFGVTVLRLEVDGIPDSRDALIDENGNGILDPGERLNYDRIIYVNAADWAAMLSIAYRTSEKLSYGLSVKLIQRSLAEFSAFGIGFDAGVLYKPTASLLIGAALQDITTTLLAWSTGRTELISPTLRVGGAYTLTAGSISIIPSVECAVRFEGRGETATVSAGPISVDPYAGIEIGYKKSFALRGGINEIGHASIGAGVRVARLHVDYAFTGFGATSDLGTTHRLSLRLRMEGVF